MYENHLSKFNATLFRGEWLGFTFENSLFAFGLSIVAGCLVVGQQIQIKAINI